jgi:hypothetical protein
MEKLVYECVLKLISGLEITYTTRVRPKLLSPNEAYTLRGSAAAPFETLTYQPWAIESLSVRTAPGQVPPEEQPGGGKGKLTDSARGNPSAAQVDALLGDGSGY